LRQTTSLIDSGIPPQQELIREIQAFLLEKLSIRVDSEESDLLETGVLDSMAQLNLLLYLEKHFGLHLPMDSLEIDSFRSVANIAELVLSYSPPGAGWPGSIDDLVKESPKEKGALPCLNTADVDERTNLIREIQALLEETLSIQVERETNLFETGVLDSMTLVQLILQLEEKFRFRLPMEDIDVEPFRSVTRIAELVANRTRNSCQVRGVE
jgi:methoxymalonate biosynthesis acyl carrier protein